MNKTYTTLFFALIFVLSPVVLSRAAEKKPPFPNKPIRLINPFAAGSGNDIQSRGLAPYLEKHIGQRVIIDNRPGADSRIGMNEAWKAVPDGHTIVTAGMPTPIINEKLFQVNYKTKEFVHIYAWSADNMCLVANAEAFKDFPDFISEARSRTLAGGITGIGSVSQITGLALVDAAGMKPVNWVPFTGGTETMASLTGGHIDFGITATVSAQALVNAGRLRILLVYSNEKEPMFPQAPLPKDFGFNLTAMPIVRGVLAPPKTPPAIARFLRQAFAKAVQEPEFLNWAKKARVVISPMNHERFFDYTLGVEKEVMKYLDKAAIKGKS